MPPNVGLDWLGHHQARSNARTGPGVCSGCFHIVQALTILFAAIGVALSLAHAVEFPSKRRLDRDTYLKVQAIYYPGFTIGGGFEPLAMIAAFALLLFTPLGTTSFWVTLAAFTGLVLAHAIYWTITHP